MRAQATLLAHNWVAVRKHYLFAQGVAHGHNMPYLTLALFHKRNVSIEHKVKVVHGAVTLLVRAIIVL